MTKRLRPDQFPPWYDGQSINEAAFCREFLASHKLLYTENSFFTPEGRMTDEAPLKTEIYQIIEPYASTSVPKKISNIIELLKITAHIDDFPPRTDRIPWRTARCFWMAHSPQQKMKSCAAVSRWLTILPRPARKRGCAS